jgi:hypothetical protein
VNNGRAMKLFKCPLCKRMVSYLDEYAKVCDDCACGAVTPESKVKVGDLKPLEKTLQ